MEPATTQQNVTDVTDLDQAKHAVVHQYAGGAKQLARLAGINYGTLCNKVNPLVETHHLTVDEAIRIQYAAGDWRILEAEAQVAGLVTMQIVDDFSCSDVELLDQYAAWHETLGRTAHEIRQALADGRIRSSDIREIKREMFADFKAAFAVLHRLQALVQDDEAA